MDVTKAVVLLQSQRRGLPFCCEGVKRRLDSTSTGSGFGFQLLPEFRSLPTKVVWTDPLKLNSSNPAKYMVWLWENAEQTGIVKSEWTPVSWENSTDCSVWRGKVLPCCFAQMQFLESFGNPKPAPLWSTSPRCRCNHTDASLVSWTCAGCWESSAVCCAYRAVQRGGACGLLVCNSL